ncbi:unnamed protein product [Aphanomyces euteiches]|uniref:Uncharacterized protein n=1 Tax=Aphanomyces euteiches TaxID=100861 RepID=A0A6G0X0R6_9STRA|nr:hypothetical protein Ae201684_009625 [Aphanomyces euteiches]KAH9085378.1 hypothetical protein Ae201684P_005086 [Aphanomyces euteiches]KAH9116992.1 hypothetical protein AeMF1_009094 [Aphanomyces euteiches]KAH9137948.1 hypothetical protein LEN26_005532 [Aphanomyces euteiches]KAH9157869.1 hypothetical protein AeRB84_000341 [Aphanomyces euteiches]
MWSSAISGTIAALSGMLGKFSSDESSSMIQSSLSHCEQAVQSYSAPWIDCAWVLVAIRVAFFVAMLLSNTLMLNFFVRGLHETDSLTATITSSAANFMMTALVGYVVFHEQLPLQWWLGATIILAGMGFLLHGAKDDEKDKAKKDN